MKKTVKQLSQELGISKPAVTQRMNAIKGFRSNYTHKIGNHLEISKKGVELLTNYRTEDHRFKTVSGKNNTKNNRSRKQNDTVYLMKQIGVKDKQIDNLQRSLDKQQTLLDQQQQLQLAAVAENRKLKEQVQKLNSLIEISKTVSKQQIIDRRANLSNVDNPNDINSKNDNRNKKEVTKNWWHFW